MFKIWNICACATRDNLLLQIMYLFLGNLVWRYLFKHGVYKWGHEYSHTDFSWEYFLVCNFFIFQRPHQLVSWNMDALKLIKRNCTIYKREYVFRKVTWPRSSNYWRNSFFKEYPNISFGFITAWKVSKYGVISGLYFPAFGLNTEIYAVKL